MVDPGFSKGAKRGGGVDHSSSW